ncbi:MAG: hypothetical protein F6K54_05495 [Okeania sp. SIO3B5]|uniref:hypothetical protein n=1 Tax=Okeania sp. SIO3B5 TaxID=2607811 RepID=UPI0013FFB017|nr:hypothetical protein [Okeania sp. SIO3B5]NEO52573.1 hypothetical protein [Okeania sp. SIO3B5]
MNLNLTNIFKVILVSPILVCSFFVLYFPGIILSILFQYIGVYISGWILYISDWILCILEWQSKKIGRFLVLFFGITGYVEEAELASEITLVYARATAFFVLIVLIAILVLVVYETIKLLVAKSPQPELYSIIGDQLGFLIVFFLTKELTKLFWR